MLLKLDSNYLDNLDYGCYPDWYDQDYNSNSYATGLLEAADIPLPAFLVGNAIVSYPGSTKPVPKAQCGPQP